MKREIVVIDRELCNGCGECIPNCHEGALQMIDGKATLVSELMCDGLGACLGHCPVGAIQIEEREAEAYNESKVMEGIVANGPNVVKAHLMHLKDHNQTGFLDEGLRWLQTNRGSINWDCDAVIAAVLAGSGGHAVPTQPRFRPAPSPLGGGGCPGSQARSFSHNPEKSTPTSDATPSELMQWPVQLHLVSPYADYFRNSDLLLAADCTAFAAGNFHARFMKGKSLAIACPKLDSNKEVYLAKLKTMVEESGLNTITVVKMEVPCCGGLLQMAKLAVESASRKIPIKAVTMAVDGEILSETWV